MTIHVHLYWLRPFATVLFESFLFTEQRKTICLELSSLGAKSNKQLKPNRNFNHSILKCTPFVHNVLLHCIDNTKQSSSQVNDIKPHWNRRTSP